MNRCYVSYCGCYSTPPHLPPSVHSIFAAAPSAGHAVEAAAVATCWTASNQFLHRCPAPPAALRHRRSRRREKSCPAAAAASRPQPPCAAGPPSARHSCEIERFARPATNFLRIRRRRRHLWPPRSVVDGFTSSVFSASAPAPVLPSLEIYQKFLRVFTSFEVLSFHSLI